MRFDENYQKIISLTLLLFLAITIHHYSNKYISSMVDYLTVDPVKIVQKAYSVKLEQAVPVFVKSGCNIADEPKQCLLIEGHLKNS